jgi:hypothetical protein
MGSVNSINCNCNCGNKHPEETALNCERIKSKQDTNDECEIENMNMLLESSENRNSVLVNNK